MDLKNTYNKIADEWVDDHEKDDWWVAGTDHLILLLKPGAKVLDVGCGGGTKTIYLANKNLDVLGIDFSEKMIEIAKEKFQKSISENNLKIKFKVLDVYEIDTLEEKFDCVFAQAVLLHIPKKRIQEVIQKCISVLKPEGFLYLAVKEIGPDGIGEKSITETDYGYEYQRFFSFFREEELTGILEQEHFKIIWKELPHSGKGRWIQVIGQNENQNKS